MDADTSEPSRGPWAPSVHCVDDEFSQLCQLLLQDDDALTNQVPKIASPIPSTPSDRSAATLLPYTQRTTDNKQGSMIPTAPCLSLASPQHFREQLVAATMAKYSHREVRMKAKEAEKRLKALAEHHAQAEAENSRLKALEKKLSACVQITEFQVQLGGAVHRSPRRPLPLPASCSEVSFSQLPPSSQWSAPWVARIKSLQPQDLLVLRRQWAQQSAVLLPQAMEYGPSCNAYQTMERLHTKYIDLLQALLGLAPHVWLESSQFDTDTLQPVAAPTAEWLRDLLARHAPQVSLQELHRRGADYHAASSGLQREYRGLLQQYKSLAQALNLHQPLGLGAGDGAGAWDSRFGFGALSSQLSSATELLRIDCPPAHLDLLQQLEDTTKLLQANAAKQKLVLLKLFSSMHPTSFHPMNFHFVLMMYPFACTSVDFVPGLLLLGDAASATARSLAPPSPWLDGIAQPEGLRPQLPLEL